MFTVRVLVNGGWMEQQYATGREALEARDRCFDAGFARVQIEGLPEVIEGCCGLCPMGPDDDDVLVIEE